MNLGSRQHPSRTLPVIEDMRLTNQCLEIERLVKENRWVELRQYVYELKVAS